MQVEIKGQSVIFHGLTKSIEAVDMGEQGFEAMLWHDGDRGQYLARKLTIKTFDSLMAFVATNLLAN